LENGKGTFANPGFEISCGGTPPPTRGFHEKTLSHWRERAKREETPQFAEKLT